MVWTDVFSQWQTYAIGLGVIFLGWNMVKGALKIVPLANQVNKNQWLMLMVGGLLLTSGIFGSLGTATVGRTSMERAQNVELLTFNLAGTATDMGGNLNQFYQTDAQVLDVAGELNGTFQICRADATSGGSMLVTVTSPDFRNPSDGSDVVNYNLIEEDPATGKKYIYLIAGSTITYTGATQGGQLNVGFVEGDVCQDISFMIELDETGQDKLRIYDPVDIRFSIPGSGYILRHLNAD